MREPVHVHDYHAAADKFPLGSTLAQRHGTHTALGIPLLLEDDAIGCLLVRRTEVLPFSDQQIRLLKAFADQAVIAIENTRLLEAEQASKRELTESLEQQTATADVLKVISRSVLDVQKVLDALVESAARLCNAFDAAILQVVGDGLRLVAHHGQIPFTGPVGQLTLPLVRGAIMGRVVLDRRTIHVADVLAEADEYPEGRKNALRFGFRTVLAVPLVHAGEAIGLILIRRGEVRPFTERQIELVNTFADQAVIAIENTRLFEEVQARTRELTESLTYQTATSEVLNVISRSKFDLQPVLDTIARTACTLCEEADSTIQLREGDGLRTVAHYGPLPVGAFRPLDRSWVPGRAVMDRLPIHVHDLLTAQQEFPLGYEIAKQFGHRTSLAIPLLRDGFAIGSFLLRRTVVRAFTDKEIASWPT